MLGYIVRKYHWRCCYLNVNRERIMQRIDAFAGFNDNDDGGISRFSYGRADADARAWLMQICRELKLQVTVDPVGNIRARYEGVDSSLMPVLVGSHIDSVRNGGKYDGIVGVVGAMEVLTVMRENNCLPRRSVELIIFAEEEGSNFGTTMVGSKTLIGKLSADDLGHLHTEDKRTCLEILEKSGLDPGKMKDFVLKPGDIEAMLELHIEQGIVLEQEKKRLGVVQAIAGMTTMEVTVCGTSNHAGATPMYLRNDPMSAAAVLIEDIEDIAANHVLESTVATVGSISCRPNMPNVIPGEVTFTIDIRDIEQDAIEKTVAQITSCAEKISQERKVMIRFRTIGSSKPIRLSPRIMDTVKRAVSSCSDSWMVMNSGAVHDAAMMASITDVGMIFVPSVGGKSHNPEEYTNPSDIALGCQALLLAVTELCV